MTRPLHLHWTWEMHSIPLLLANSPSPTSPESLSLLQFFMPHTRWPLPRVKECNTPLLCVYLAAVLDAEGLLIYV